MADADKQAAQTFQGAEQRHMRSLGIEEAVHQSRCPVVRTGVSWGGHFTCLAPGLKAKQPTFDCRSWRLAENMKTATKAQQLWVCPNSATHSCMGMSPICFIGSRCYRHL